MMFILILIMYLIVMAAIVLIKNDVTLNNQMIITKAIYLYNKAQIHCGKYENLIDYEDMESYVKTLFRFWDWGYTRILPPEKMELIRPYIKDGDENDN